MYAVIETGGKQQIVKKDDQILIELLPDNEDKSITIDKVLLVSDGKKVKVGTPYLEGAAVTCDVLGDAKGKKLIIYKYRRRKSSQKKTGHRQKYLKVQVKEIKA